MPIIFSDANAYQEDLGPNEGEMFFTNLLSGLQKGVEEGGRRKYAQELRQQELADRLSAEQRQQGYLTGAEQRQQGYVAEAEKRREAAQIGAETRQLANARTVAEEADARAQQRWEQRGGQIGVEQEKLQLEESRRKAQQAATETSQQTMAESAMGDLAGLSQMPGGVPYASGYGDIDARVQSASDEIANRAQSIMDPVARNRFMEQANTRLRNELQMFTEQQRAKQQAEEQRRVEEGKLVDAETAAAHIESGGRFIPKEDTDYIVRGLSTREDALNSLYKKGRLKPEQWSRMIGELLGQYTKYTIDRLTLSEREKDRKMREWLRLMEGKSGSSSGPSNDMEFNGAMGGASVRDFPSGTQLPTRGIVNQAEAFLRSQQ